MSTDLIKPENVYALVVGIEKYQGYNGLNGSSQDALNFANWLLDHGVPPEHIQLFISPLDQNVGVLEGARTRRLAPLPAERNEIESAIRSKLTNIDNRGDLLHVFWSGHGVITKTDATKRRLFFADTDENNMRNLNFNSLVEALSTFARGAGFKQQIFWIDACANQEFKGLYETMGAETAASVFVTNGEQRKVEQFVFFAADLYEEATNESLLGIGRFSRAVLGELQGNSLLPDMKQLAEKIRADFLVKQQLVPVYWWSKVGGNSEEVANIFDREISSKLVNHSDVLKSITSEQICEALEKALPSKILLERMLKNGMDERLDLIVSTIGSVKDIIFNLVNWAEDNERVMELIRAAYKANPRKTELYDLAKSLGIVDE
jgi:hypothetical protein